ncbi:lipopolysaccharide biosynthesis protein [Tsuneonella troitsensis]|uniref:lipopolysaccharide biosynthesis protein n=1 Tax=Tsuneonella troitsensis TaxID=292222 RepID=UPI000710DE0A|nr:lipopolysaccharide biosynthesis protein [Tsuneonella troitsensis]
MTGADPAGLGLASRIKFLVKDTALYGIASAVGKLSSLILFPFLTRALSVADYGRVDLILYAAMFFGLLMIFGQDSAVARYFFEDEDPSRRRRMISQALAVMMLNGLLAVATMLALSLHPAIRGVFGDDWNKILLLLIAFAPLNGLLSYCQGILKWSFRRAKFLIISLGAPFANLALIVGFGNLSELTLLRVMTIMVAVNAGFVLLGLFFIREWLTWPRDTEYVRKLLPLALPYGLIAAIGASVPLLERSVVASGFGEHDLGLYAAGAKIAALATLACSAFQMGWGPFSYAIYKRPDAGATYDVVLRLFTLVICLVVLFLSAAAEPLIALLAGKRYEGAGLFVFPLAMAVATQAIGWISEIGIHLSKRSYLNLIGFASFLIVAVTGMFVFTKFVGVIGIALGSLAGQLVMAATSAAVGQKAYPIAWRFGPPFATIAATLAIGAAAYCAETYDSSPPPSVICALGMFAILIGNMLFGFSQAEFRGLRQSLKKSLGDTI